MTLYRKSLQHVKKLQKQTYNKITKSRTYTPGD